MIAGPTQRRGPVLEAGIDAAIVERRPATGPTLSGRIVECGTERALWLPYVEVASVAAATRQALALDASMTLAPREGPIGWRSVVTTPAGGEIAFLATQALISKSHSSLRVDRLGAGALRPRRADAPRSERKLVPLTAASVVR